MLNKHILFSATLLAVSAFTVSQAATLTGTVSKTGDGVYDIFAEIIDGSDTDGLAGYSLVLSGLEDLSVDPSGISWAENTLSAIDSSFTNVGFTSSLLTGAVGTDGYSAAHAQGTVANPVLQIGKEAVFVEHINPAANDIDLAKKALLGTLTIPGAVNLAESNVKLNFSVFPLDFTPGTGQQTFTPDITTIFEGGGTDPGLEAMYVGSSSLNEDLQGAFSNRNYGTILLEGAVMLSDVAGGNLADLSPMAEIVFADGTAGATGTLTDDDSDGKYDIEIDGDWASVAPGTELAGELVFTTDVVGASPAEVRMPFSIRVPEPSTYALAGLALFGLVGFARRK